VATYHNEIYWLSKYLGGRHLDISNHIYEFLRWKESEDVLERAGVDREALDEAYENMGESDDIYELTQKIESVMSNEEREELAAIIAHKYPTDAPPWAHMDVRRNRLPRGTWLVHFSDQTGDIVDKGFTRGVSDMEQVALTTYFTDNAKKYGGYNFAFVAGNRDSRNAAAGKYGKGAVMFQSSGVEIYHYGDEELQVIYWGKAVDPRTIVELAKEDRDTWMVVPRYRSSMSQAGRDFAYRGSFTDVVNWVENNWFQYRRQIMGK
jgi:hypothetical protein